MISLDFTNVFDKFRTISGCDDEKISENISLVEDEIFTLENLIDENRFDEKYRNKCEYAAAVSAFYNYLCKESAREKICLSEVGKVIINDDFSQKLSSAKELKKQALESISQIMVDNDFIFTAI